MRPDLPETYYLDNVLTLFEHVSRVYGDILESSQVEFLVGFDRLGPDAQKLCIRLLNRSHDYFRASKLNYSEITAIEDALTELAQAGFIALDGDIERPTLLALFTRAELLALVDHKSGLDKLRRHELDAALLERDDAACFEALARSDSLVQVLRNNDYQICQMLFFGNLNQSMTDFVLRDLGLYQFETYSIDHDHRPYRTTLEIQQHWLLYQLESLFKLADVSNGALLEEIIDMMPDGIEMHAPAYRKCERLRYEIARQFERLDDLERAVRLYHQCRLPPSRERVARIHDKQGSHAQALDACLQIVDDPLGEDETQFACMFATRLARRHQLPLPPVVEQNHGDHQPEIIELELEYHASVEIAVAEHYATLDNSDSCFYLENSLFNGVLGLLFWDVVFAPLPGAFFNPFQNRPSDFYAFDFCASREQLIAQTWDSISTNADIWRVVASRWQQKQGLMNPLVNWQSLELEIIEIALERIDHAHWRAVFERILADLRNNRAGFPDLVHFPPSGGYCLIEVKGPGDSLQKNQQRWMQYFHEHGIPHRLARVTWQTG